MTAGADIVETFVAAGEMAARLGVLPEAIDELVARLEADGLLDELTRRPWNKAPVALDRPSFPGPKRGGCALALPLAIAARFRRSAR